jgi:hypothetical protein
MGLSPVLRVGPSERDGARAIFESDTAIVLLPVTGTSKYHRGEFPADAIDSRGSAPGEVYASPMPSRPFFAMRIGPEAATADVQADHSLARQNDVGRGGGWRGRVSCRTNAVTVGFSVAWYRRAKEPRTRGYRTVAMAELDT